MIKIFSVLGDFFQCVSLVSDENDSESLNPLRKMYFKGKHFPS